MDRTCHHTEAAHEHQRLEAMETRLLELTATRVVPFMNTDSLLLGISEAAVSAPMLENASVPRRPHYVPYHNELVRKTLGGKGLSMTVAAVEFAALFWVATTSRPIFP